MKAGLIIILCIISFLAGMFYQKWDLLESGTVELTTSLELQASPENIGLLPKGTIMYPYSSLDTETFVIFVNTSNLNHMKAVELEHPLTVAPIDAYEQ
ncbi:DUF4094 domain-containing protein [Thalassotalea litorea]|uniref:DUF4094 domain-containing protein n=1 Tax=Thalassotalea litorea TaxID=2020715 RepID=UPI003735A22E